MPPVPSNRLARTTREDSYRKRSLSPANHHLARASSSSKQRLVATSALSLSPESECEVTQPFVPQRSEDGLYYETEYRDEIVKWMLEMETLPSTDLIDQQPEVEWHMRPYLMDFILEMHEQWRLRPEVLYLTVNIIDRYCSRRVVYRRHYQLIGCAALLIASKFEDSKDRVPPISELHDVCCASYELSSFVQMESHMLNTIQWVIGHPTTEAWLRHFVKAPSAAQSEEARVQNVARFIMEQSMYHRQFVDARPSIMAWSALMIARYIFGKRRRAAPEFFTSADVQAANNMALQLDTIFHDKLSTVSEILTKKYMIAGYQHASTVVSEFYLSGNRFKVQYEPSTPYTPVPSTPGLTSSSYSSRSRMVAVSPGSTFSCASSDAGDEPMTPSTPSQIGGVVPNVPTVNDYLGAKENRPPHGEMRATTKSTAMPPPAVVPPRPALHVINGAASLGVPTRGNLRRLSN